MGRKQRRARRSLEETRAVMLEAGMQQLEREGIQYGVDHLTLDAACTATDVSRSSSHAAWASDDDHAPQARYQRAVIERWVNEREGLMFAEAAQIALAEAFEARGETLGRGEIIRIAIQAAVEAAVEPDERGAGSGFLSTDMALKHALASQPTCGRDPEIARWIHDSEVDNREKRIEDTYKPLAVLLGLRPRDAYGEAAYEHLSLAIAALVEGTVLRHLIVPERGYAHRSIRDDGTGVASTLVGVCVEALVEEFFEPV